MKYSASFVSAAATALFAVNAAADSLSIDSESDIKASAKTIAGNALKYYHGNEEGHIPGLLGGPPPAGDYYWWSGSVLMSSLIDYWFYTGDSAHNDLVMQGMLHQVGENRDFLPANQTKSIGNDDQGFWGIAAMLAAERGFPDPPRDQPQWLALAKAVFNDLAGRWDDQTCDGGLRWQVYAFNVGYTYKSAISNGALLNLAARLHRYTGNQTYADWAEKTWAWSTEIGFITDDGAIYDGAHVEKNCTDFNKIEFSYVNAIYALSAAHMANATGDSEWKGRLDKVTSHGLEHFIKDGAVTEPACENNGTCNTDMTFFKGIFHQFYATAAQVAPSLADKVFPALEKSADAAVKTCTGDDDKCETFSWAGGEDPDDKVGKAGYELNALSAVTNLLAKDGKGPYTSKTGGTSTGGSDPVGTNSTGNGTDGGAGGKDGKDGNPGKGDKGGGDGKSAASTMGASVVFGVVMAGMTAMML